MLKGELTYSNVGSLLEELATELLFLKDAGYLCELLSVSVPSCNIVTFFILDC